MLILLLRPPPLAWQQIFQFHVQAANDLHQGILSAASSAGAWYWSFLVLVGCAGILNLRRSPKDRPTTIAVLVFAVTGPLFVFLHRPIFGHHMLLFVMPGSVLVAVPANGLLTSVRGRESLLPTLTILAAAFVCATQWAIFNVGQPFREAQVEACLRTFPLDFEIVSDDQELLARAGLRTPPWLVDTARVRIKSGYLSDDEIATAMDHADGVLLSPAMDDSV